MTNQELESRIETLLQEERRITTELLPLIHLAEVRKLYLESGYGDVYETNGPSHQTKRFQSIK